MNAAGSIQMARASKAKKALAGRKFAEIPGLWHVDPDDLSADRLVRNLKASPKPRLPMEVQLAGNRDPLGIKSVLDDLDVEAIQRALESLSTAFLKSFTKAGGKSTAPLSQPVDLTPALDRLVHLAKIPSDWDAEGGEEPTSVAIAMAAKVVVTAAQRFQLLAGNQVLPFVLAPLADGGIQVEWRTDILDLELEVGRDGELGYLLVEHGDSPSYEEGESLSLDAALHLIGRVLGAGR